MPTAMRLERLEPYQTITLGVITIILGLLALGIMTIQYAPTMRRLCNCLYAPVRSLRECFDYY